MSLVKVDRIDKFTGSGGVDTDTLVNIATPRPYSQGILIKGYNELFSHNNKIFRLKSSVPIPYVISGPEPTADFVDLDSFENALAAVGGTASQLTNNGERYDIITADEGVVIVDLNERNICVIDATVNNLEVQIQNEPIGQSTIIVFTILGNNIITWPEDILWDLETAPELGDNITIVTLLYNGYSWIGQEGAKQ